MKGTTILCLFVGIIVAAMMMAAVAKLFVFKKDEDGNTVEGKTVTNVILSILFGLATFVSLYGVYNWPKKFAWLYIIAMLALTGASVLAWKANGSNKREFTYTAIMISEFTSVGAAAAALYKSTWPLLAVVLAGIFAIGYCGHNALRFYQHGYAGKAQELEKAEKSDETEAAKAESTRFKRYANAVLVATIIVAIVAGFAIFSLGDKGSSSASDGKKDETTMEQVDLPDEAEEYLIQWTKNDENRLDSEFSKKLKKEAGDGEITGEIVKKVILDNCKDPRWLAIWAYRFGVYENPNEYKPLMMKDNGKGKGKLSEKGVSLYNEVKGYLSAVTAEREEAPEDGTNTGYKDGFVVAETSGISGDRTGTKMTCPNGEYFWVMDRCGNIVYKGNPPSNVPTGPTDNPTPTPTPTPKKQPSQDPVNRGNANKGGGQGRSNDGAGEEQPTDPRTEHPTGSGNDNNKGHSDPATVTPSNPPAKKPAVTDSNPMNYKPDPVTNRGPADSSQKPTSSEGDGEFTPTD